MERRSIARACEQSRKQAGKETIEPGEQAPHPRQDDDFLVGGDSVERGRRKGVHVHRPAAFEFGLAERGAQVPHELAEDASVLEDLGSDDPGAEGAYAYAAPRGFESQ